jgi:hypothetical protein
MATYGDRERCRAPGSDDRRAKLAPDGLGAECGQDIAWILDCLITETDEHITQEHAGAISRSSRLH